MPVMKNRFLLFCLTLIFSMLSASLSADVMPSALFQDSAVLQRQKPLRIWGKAAPGETVKVTLKGKTAETKADKDGKWLVTLPPFESENVPQTMIIEGKNRIELKDVLIGEVFLAGGQSNMEVTVKEALNPKEEIANAKHPLIREFLVENDWDTKPSDAVKGKWTVVSPETAANIGAVGYYFARELQKELKVPVGIINTAVSATPAEAWTPEETLRAKPEKYAEYLNVMKRFYDTGKEEVVRRNTAAIQERQNRRTKFNDRIENSVNGPRYKDNSPSAQETGWVAGPLSGSWASYDPAAGPGSCPLYGDDICGAFRYRKSVTVPDSLAGTDLKLFFTWAVDISVYFNGTKLSSPDGGRTFDIPASLVRAGENTLAIRFFQHYPKSDFFARTPKLGKSHKEQVSIAGAWNVSAEEILIPIEVPIPFISEMRTPTVLFNAMISPLSNSVFRGVIWYQGESNQRAIELYKELFPDMITAWRKTFSEPELPFYFVLVAAYGAVETNPNTHGGWAFLREAQSAALALPGTAMTTALDIGDAKNIHPLNKQEVGRRLACIALNRLFGRSDINCEMPKVQDVSFEGAKAIITFSNAVTLKTNDGKPVRAFAVMDKPGFNRFRWANAEINGNKVILTCPEYDVITAVRYGWAGNPDVNLVNEHGLPALPFNMIKK